MSNQGVPSEGEALVEGIRLSSLLAVLAGWLGDLHDAQSMYDVLPRRLQDVLDSAGADPPVRRALLFIGMGEAERTELRRALEQLQTVAVEQFHHLPLHLDFVSDAEMPLVVDLTRLVAELGPRSRHQLATFLSGATQHEVGYCLLYRKGGTSPPEAVHRHRAPRGAEAEAFFGL